MEVEFWPVMLEEARRAGCALCLANSQVPSKSFPRAARLSRLAGHPVTQAAGVFAKSEHIATRFRALGANPVIAMGETRFDIPPPARLIKAGQNVGPGRPVLTLASVVAGEEELYTRAIAELLAGLGKKFGVDPGAVAVAWLLAHPARVLPVLGTNDPARIARLADALTVPMDRETWFELYTAALGREVA